MQKGHYIVFEGVVGTGKTTQSKRLLAVLRARFPEREILWTREPGGDAVAEAIRELVQAREYPVPMEPLCEVYLFAAARAQSLRSVVKPALDRGAIVIADRNYMSSVAFQGFGRDLGAEMILSINAEAVNICKPDFVVFLDTPLEVALTRTSDRAGDKFESLDLTFFSKVAAGYKFMSEHESFRDVWHRIDGDASVDEVFDRVESLIQPSL